MQPRLWERVRWDPQDADPTSPTARARGLIYLYALGPTTAFLTLPLPHERGFHHASVFAISSAALAVTVLVIVKFDRMPPWSFGVLTVAATVAVTAVNIFSGSDAAPYLAFYVWVALYAGYFFTPRAAAGHIALIAIGGIACAATADTGSESWSRAVLILASCAVAAAIVQRLRVLTAQLVDELSAAALTDELTGLGNRRQFVADLEQALQTATLLAPAHLSLLDLDGFKRYNDGFGHPAGDALLRRLAERLSDSVAPARAYRLGGDEFCVLGESSASEETARLAGRALSEHGEGFAVEASCGQVLLPADAPDASSALRLADERMYARKGVRRVSPERQARDLALQIVAEQQPLLHDHLREVADFARAVALSLGLTAEEAEHVATAAELHDIGKVAVPSAILEKPGPLTPQERTFIERHTLIGERMLAAAPALVPVSRIVRSTHERWDGTGYPDALAGDAIPLSSRIVAVCDAFDAMTSRRPYRSPVTAAEACDELRRCAGGQFDALVVEAFVQHAQAPQLT